MSSFVALPDLAVDGLGGEGLVTAQIRKFVRNKLCGVIKHTD